MALLKEQFNKLQDIEFPVGLHGRIMKRVLFLRVRNLLGVTIASLLMNVFVSGLYLYDYLSEAEAFRFLKSLAEQFELTSEFFSATLQTIQNIFELVPAGAVVFFGLNLALIMYIGFISIRTNKMSLLKVEPQ